MLKYRGNKLIRTGFIGVVLSILIVLVGLSPESLTSLATAIRYQAQFSDAGGLTPGNDVTIAGIKVGGVSDVGLAGRNALVTFTIDGTVELGSDTTAHVRTGTLLGERVLTLESAGDGTMQPMDVIPVSRTASPYSLTEAVSELTTNTAGTDTSSLNQSLDTLSETTGSGCATTRSGVRRNHASSRRPSTTETTPWANCSTTAPTSPESCRSAAHR